MNTHFVNEGGEAVVEGLDLLFLLSADSLNIGVNFQVEGGQQALVEGYSGDVRRIEAATTKTSTKTTTVASTHAAAAEAIAATSSTKSCTEAWTGTHARSPDAGHSADPARAGGKCVG